MVARGSLFRRFRFKVLKYGFPEPVGNLGGPDFEGFTVSDFSEPSAFLIVTGVVKDERSIRVTDRRHQQLHRSLQRTARLAVESRIRFRQGSHTPLAIPLAKRF